MNTQKIDDVNIASMLFTLGFSQERHAKQIRKRNGKIQFHYFFKSKSDCGEYKLNDCLEAWADEAFLDENPTHELTIIKVFSDNRFHLLSEIKAEQGMLDEISHNGSTALVNLKAPKAEIEKLFNS